MSVIKMPPHKTVQKVIILKSDEWSQASRFGNFFMITQVPLNNRSKSIKDCPFDATMRSCNASEILNSFAASLTAFAFILGIDGPKIFCRGLISVARQRNRRSRSLGEVTLGEVTTSVTRLSGRLATPQAKTPNPRPSVLPIQCWGFFIPCTVKFFMPCAVKYNVPQLSCYHQVLLMDYIIYLWRFTPLRFPNPHLSNKAAEHPCSLEPPVKTPVNP